ncbi:hypothetical protein HPP92_026062 [Vanilla planifolia]|uniref:Plant PDR ABC transporter associated domain-containing protein n=1 Tax=Vanilla planifolia TaxID=51239 RepID=A0A835PJ03_VANPL|nr:hypothetical protein HPP92_026062 [Vanilla planifolia]
MESFEDEIGQMEESFSSTINHLLSKSNIKSIEDYVDDNLKLQWATIENGGELLLYHQPPLSKSNVKSIEDYVEDNLKLQWATIESLPSTRRMRSSLFGYNNGQKNNQRRVVDVSKLNYKERQMFIDSLIRNIEHDNLQLLENIKERIKRVDVKLPTMEVRYKGLTVEAQCKVRSGTKMPNLWNSINGFLKDDTFIRTSRLWKNNIIISPCRTSKQASKDIMLEVGRREKQAKIIPNPDIDTYMKAIAVKSLQQSLQTNYILKILGLETCSETIIGDAVRRGISGGQKRRTCMDRELLLLKRNSFVYLFKTIQPTSENMTLGQQILKKEGVDFKSYFYWLSAGALFGLTVLFNIGITLALAYMNDPGASKATISNKSSKHFDN